MKSRSYLMQRGSSARLLVAASVLIVAALALWQVTHPNRSTGLLRGLVPADQLGVQLDTAAQGEGQWQSAENPGKKLAEQDVQTRDVAPPSQDWKTYWETSSDVALRYPPAMPVRFDTTSSRVVFTLGNDAFAFQLIDYLRLASQAYRAFEERGARMDTFEVVRIGERLYATVQLPDEDGCRREAYLVPRPNGNVSVVLTFRFCVGGALQNSRDTILASLGFPDAPSYETWQTVSLGEHGIKLAYPKAYGHPTLAEDGRYYFVERLSFTITPITTFDEANNTCNGQRCELIKEAGGLRAFMTTEGELKGFMTLPGDQAARALELRESAGSRGLFQRILESIQPR
ncbi:hypothetical protein HY375_01835 [Candidatus Berkelbacteria bacterium]|nr:hypothetical protein [Candidatus Berkelbacteria bacterium]